jgi:hypothetical protein
VTDRSTVLMAIALGGVLGAGAGLSAQSIKDVQASSTPLFEGCQALIGRLKAAGGNGQMLKPSDRGIRGNSHMIMQDKNNLQLADLILQWVAEQVSKRK